MIDKLSEKIQLKNYDKWTVILGSIDSLLFSISEVFFSNTSAIKITILDC